MDRRPAEVSRSKGWTEEQRKEFGARLKWSFKRAGYSRAAEALMDVQECTSLKPRTFYSHVSGERVPDDDGLVEIYAQLFDVSMDFLLLREPAPKGPSRGRLPIDEVRQRLGLHSATKPSSVLEHVNHVSVNQVLERDEQKTSHFTDIRYISILSASDIRDLLTGTRKLRTMSRERLPVPPDVAAGPNVIAYKIPIFDHSMVSPEGSGFPPGTRLVFDPDRAIAPGDYLLALQAGAETPVLRRLQSTHAFMAAAPRYPFKLVALSPLAAPIFVETADDCAILGRAIFELKSL